MEDTGHEDVTRVQVGDKEVLLIGTAHISQQSVEVVREIIASEQPDTVCVELDEERFKAMRQQQRWEELDLKQVIREGKFMFLMARLALSSFQKRMGTYTGVKPGAEMAAAVEIAEAHDMELVLCDRNVRTTLLRAWRKTPFYKRAGLAGTLLAGSFERTEINEEELANLRQQQNISTILDEMGDVLPEVKEVLVDERDTFMAHQIMNAPGERVAVVIGAAHKPGILKKLQTNIPESVIADISVVPDKSFFSKALPWLLPMLVIALFGYGLYNSNWEQLQQAFLAWVLANGVLSAIGAIAALGHPVTVIAAFVAAPITSLNPTVGAGMVTAFVQTMFKPPRVKDLENVGDDILEWRGWWGNLLTRILLVFILSSLGSAIGTFVALWYLKNLI